jgi:exonuclease III
MHHKNVDIISWNIRGLNATARCLTVHETLAATSGHIACLQETKLQTVDTALDSFLKAYKLDKFAYKHAAGTRGGILLLWNDSHVDINNIRIGRYTLSANITLRHRMSHFVITAVYRPSRRTEKVSFLKHMRGLKPTTGASWLILRDFNLIYKTRNKNNRNLNINLMRRFRHAIDFCGLKELSLQKQIHLEQRASPAHLSSSRPLLLQPELGSSL